MRPRGANYEKQRSAKWARERRRVRGSPRARFLTCFPRCRVSGQHHRDLRDYMMAP